MSFDAVQKKYIGVEAKLKYGNKFKRHLIPLTWDAAISNHIAPCFD